MPQSQAILKGHGVWAEEILEGGSVGITCTLQGSVISTFAQGMFRKTVLFSALTTSL